MTVLDKLLCLGCGGTRTLLIFARGLPMHLALCSGCDGTGEVRP